MGVKQTAGYRSRAVRHAVNFARTLARDVVRDTVRRGLRSGFGQLGTETETKTVHNNYVTGQRDHTRQYRYKRMPRRKKKRWLRFKRKVNAAMDSSRNCTILRNKGVGFASPLSGNLLGYAILNGVNGTDNVAETNGSGMDDIRDIANAFDSSGLKFQGRKWRITSGVLDVTLRNVGFVDLEVDVYTIGYVRTCTNEQIGSNGVTFNTRDPIEIYNAIADSTANASGMSAVTPGQRGWTPFNTPQAARWIKVFKKDKFLLPAGNTVFLQHRYAKNFNINLTGMENYSALGRHTRGFFIVAKAVTGALGEEIEMSMGITRTYNVNYNPMDVVTEGTLTT